MTKFVCYVPDEAIEDDRRALLAEYAHARGLTIEAPIAIDGKGATRFRVSTGHLKTVQIPLPARAEQRRIVAKVDALMALCDRLEASPTATARRRSADALLAEALAPAEDRELDAAE